MIRAEIHELYDRFVKEVYLNGNEDAETEWLKFMTWYQKNVKSNELG